MTNSAIDLNGVIGIPYLFGGRNVSTGVDCWGLTAHVLRLFGTPVPRDWEPSSIVEACRIMTREADSGTGWEEVTFEPGAVAAMFRRRIVEHVGVCLASGILHTTPETGAVIQTPRRLLRVCGFDRVRYYRWVGGASWV